jgi:TPR repeat protein
MFSVHSRCLVRIAVAAIAIAAASGLSQAGPGNPAATAAPTTHVSPLCQKLDAFLQTLTPAQQETSIGMLFAQGQCRPLDHQQALAHLRAGARLGDTDAMYDFFVTSGGKETRSPDRKMRHDQTEGVSWLQKSANSANWRAALVLGGACYRDGACGLKRNPDLSLHWCQRYAELAPSNEVAKHSDCSAMVPSNPASHSKNIE